MTTTNCPTNHGRQANVAGTWICEDCGAECDADHPDQVIRSVSDAGEIR